MIFNYQDDSTEEFLFGPNKYLKDLQFHENIVQIFKKTYERPKKELFQKLPNNDIDIFCENFGDTLRKTVFMEFEYFPFSLKFILEEFGTFLRPSDIYDFCLQITNAVSFLYQNNLLHLDLNLPNILVSPCLRVALSEFHYSRKFKQNCFVETLEINDAEGGNPLHLAPEILNASKIEGKSKTIDFKYQPSFALGVLFYEIATHGKSPFNVYPVGRRPNCTLPAVDFSMLTEYDKTFVGLIKQLIAPPPRILPDEILNNLKQIMNAF